MEHTLKQKLAGLSLSEEQIDLLNFADKFCRDASPIETVRTFMPTDKGFSREVWNDIVAMGWTGITVPEHYGGVGLGLGEVVPVIEMMGRRLMATPFLTHTLATQAILMGASEEQKAQSLLDILEGKVATLALSEPNGDYDLNNITMTAKATEAGYRLSGIKTFVLHFEVANCLILSAKLDGETRLFLIETAGLTGVNVRRETVIDETKRSYALEFNGTEIPKSSLMPRASTQSTLKHIHLSATLLYAAEMVGGTKACLDYTVEYLKTRKQFGRLIGSYQALKHPIVDAFVDYEKSRSLLYSAASHCDDPNSGETAIRMAKVKADTTFAYTADRAIQFHGGFGFTYDCDAQLYRRRAIFDAAQFGGARYHKGELARTLFG